MKTKKYLAIDFGASNGRATICSFDGSKLNVEEVHRFNNQPVYANKVLYWDILRLYFELKVSLKKAIGKYKELSSMSVNTWGIDFALLDKEKMLLSNPIHYRDLRTEGIYKKVFEIKKEKDLYKEIGVQFMQMNTLFQLYSMVLKNSFLLKNAAYFIMLGDLFNFFLTGEILCEYTNATTTQLFSLNNKNWSKYIIETLNIPINIFQKVTEPGIIIEKLSKELCQEIGCNPIPVSLSAYDTSSEIAAIPISSENRNIDWAFFCCGTWAMVGIVSEKPIINDKGYIYGYGNEGGAEFKYNYLKNMVGMWIIQKCRGKWVIDYGKFIGWDEIIEIVLETPEKDIFIDIDESSFEKEIFDMPSTIINYCKNTNQEIPDSIGAISRVFYQSLVLKLMYNIKNLEDATLKKIQIIHMVGGGSKNTLLCQWIADALNVLVVSGPSETTTMGNILYQMLAKRDIKDLEQGRQILRNSVLLKHYNPIKNALWENKFDLYLKFLKSRKI